MKAELIAWTEFDRGIAERLGMPIDPAASDAELLIEAAGRECYQSHHNPANKTNLEYIAHIIEGGHGSVLEHSCATFRITGVSRSLTHELIRHRAGFAYSELSQRYVNVEDAEFVVPPALQDWTGAESDLRYFGSVIRDLYTHFVGLLEAKGLPRKQAREAARCVMPNCTETKIVVSANFRAWRHFIEMRGSEYADAEIRRLAVEVCCQLAAKFPAVFGDYQLYQMDDGEWAIRTEHRKV